jgi:hypothetical protein
MRVTLRELRDYSLLEWELAHLQSAFLAVGISAAAPIGETPPDLLRAVTAASQGLSDEEVKAIMEREIEQVLVSLRELHESARRLRAAIQDVPGIDDERATIAAVDAALTDFFRSDAVN